MTLNTTARNLLATIVVLGLLVAAVGSAVFSAYTSVASNDGNTFTAGTIALTDNDSGSALFNVQGFTPGDTFVRCIQVSYASTGGVQSSVRFFGQTGGNGLDEFLDVRVRRGTTTAVNPSGDCAGFTPDAVDYNGDGNGVIVNSTLRAFPDDYATGIVDPAASWSAGASAVYEIAISVQSSPLAQGLDATQDFSFEARNL